MLTDNVGRNVFKAHKGACTTVITIIIVVKQYFCVRHLKDP